MRRNVKRVCGGYHMVQLKLHLAHQKNDDRKTNQRATMSDAPVMECRGFRRSSDVPSFVAIKPSALRPLVVPPCDNKCCLEEQSDAKRLAIGEGVS
jgi:hypothetical protein